MFVFVVLLLLVMLVQFVDVGVKFQVLVVLDFYGLFQLKVFILVLLLQQLKLFWVLDEVFFCLQEVIYCGLLVCMFMLLIFLVEILLFLLVQWQNLFYCKVVLWMFIVLMDLDIMIFIVIYFVYVMLIFVNYVFIVFCRMLWIGLGVYNGFLVILISMVLFLICFIIGWLLVIIVCQIWQVVVGEVRFFGVFFCEGFLC